MHYLYFLQFFFFFPVLILVLFYFIYFFSFYVIMSESFLKSKHPLLPIYETGPKWVIEISVRVRLGQEDYQPVHHSEAELLHLKILK